MSDFRQLIKKTLDEHMLSHQGRCECGAFVQGSHVNPTVMVRNHMTEVLLPLFEEAKALGWEEAKREVRGIPNWYADEEHHGFDLWENEEGEAQEGGARIEVMRVLNNNPYKKGYVEERPRGKSTEWPA